MYNCVYALFYRGPLGRLVTLAKSATLLKYCINKIKNKNMHELHVHVYLVHVTFLRFILFSTPFRFIQARVNLYQGFRCSHTRNLN